jgi:hypothetical protein
MTVNAVADMKRAVADYRGAVRKFLPGETTHQEKKRRPPSHTGEEKRVRRAAEKHGYRLHKPRGHTLFTLIGSHDRVVLDGATMDDVDAFLGGAPPNEHSFSDADNHGAGSGS